MKLNNNLEKLPELSIYPHLDEICNNLKNSFSNTLVLTAETAAGKSTGVPCALLKHFSGKIYMLEPRRLAVFSIANRISEILNEETGKTVGYRMQLENKTSKETRLEIITEAILTRYLQEDPLLEGISVVVLDEFHERSIHSDLALAFLKEAMQIRDDLYVIVMSATMNTKAVSEYLGKDNKACPIMNIKGRIFPVEIEYKKISVENAILSEIETLKKNKYRQASGILVFLPGLGEIKRVYENLDSSLKSNNDIEIFLLHSSINSQEQKKILNPIEDGIIRIVLSSSIAETSITVPGISVVIDTGLSRYNKLNIALGMEKLITETESQFSADQRAGRAGRLGPGKCIRLWDKNEKLPLMNMPEILRTDLTSLVLECFQRQVYKPEDLSWLDEPGSASWNGAIQLLELLGCIKDGKITDLGKTVSKLGIHPRLACVALTGQFETVLKFSNYANSSFDLQKKFITNLKSRIEQSNFSKLKIENGLLAGFPDRLCHLENEKYKFPSGRIARLSKTQSDQFAVLPEWIIAPEVDAGEIEGKIYSFEIIDFSKINEWIINRTSKEIITFFEGNRIQKIENICYGKIILSSKKLSVSSEDYASAVCNEIKQKGLKILPIDEKTKAFLLRAEFYEQQNKVENKKSNSEYLKSFPEEWLLPFLGTNNSISSQTIYDSLYWYLNGKEIDRLAPEFIILDNGKKRRLNYEKQTLSENHTKLIIRPVLEVIIQQIFGCFKTPNIMGMPVLLKLLSPARRPLQITDDLEGFWNGSWPQICKEMKGRYPKHNWDYRTSEKE